MIRYSISCSLDGFIEDSEGNFDFAHPSEEVHAFVNDRLRSVRTYVFGRRMYETMRVWDTLDEVTTERTRLEREFDPAAVRALGGEIEIGGPDLAGSAWEAGLFDLIELYVYPVILGAGTPVLPAGARMELKLADTRRFDNGAVYLAYAR